MVTWSPEDMEAIRKQTLRWLGIRNPKARIDFLEYEGSSLVSIALHGTPQRIHMFRGVITGIAHRGLLNPSVQIGVYNVFLPRIVVAEVMTREPLTLDRMIQQSAEATELFGEDELERHAADTRKYGVFAGGELVSTYDTESEAKTAADDVRGDYPDMLVETDVIPEER